MITIFNRKELIITFGMQRQAKIRELMAQYSIQYSIKVINRKSPSPFDAGSRARTGTFGENLQLEYEYILYVKKIDYKKANAIIDGKIK
ncbi:hypothetical protein [Lacrimispora celerecrescens]|uniref:DUF2007 domain-containing protein n=1 Tax=Lacrimispora celerecrescens TaxID=29354 RepID=A0A084JB73_9FIRM|nr:hypothetical protein [Lacrimispora celerecrescens]KEZ86207.1 hypothetical protein IO98_23250 [Lacrimispora celerecrescens]